MNQQKSEEQRLLIAACYIFAALFAFVCFYWQVIYPPCCDADGYLRVAKAYVLNGITPNEPEMDGLRLYGYPLFLSLILKLSSLTGLQFNLLLFCIQLSLYLFAVHLLSRVLETSFSSKISTVVSIALLCNLFVYPYLAIALTDGFTVILCVFLAWSFLVGFLSVGPQHNLNKFIYSAALSGFLVGFAVMVRPASIYLLFVALLVGCCFFACYAKRSVLYHLIVTVAFCIGFSLAVAPQLIYNYVYFKAFTFMPVAGLGSTQLDWGTHVLKYLTNLSGGNMQMCYKSPWSLGAQGAGLAWYLHNPWTGVRTIFFHIYGVLDFDYLFPYVYKLNIWYRPLLFIFSQFIIYWGISGFALATKDLHALSRSKPSLENKMAFLLCGFGLLSFFVGWGAVHAFSGSENRWALPVVAALLPFAVWSAFVRQHKGSVKWGLRLCFLLYLGIAIELSQFLGALKQFCS